MLPFGNITHAVDVNSLHHVLTIARDASSGWQQNSHECRLLQGMPNMGCHTSWVGCGLKWQFLPETSLWNKLDYVPRRLKWKEPSFLTSELLRNEEINFEAEPCLCRPCLFRSLASDQCALLCCTKPYPHWFATRCRERARFLMGAHEMHFVELHKNGTSKQHRILGAIVCHWWGIMLQHPLSLGF